MNLPNKLTIFRVILIPFFVVFLLLDPSNQTYRYIADAIFIIASLTDMLDGKIARKYNLVTNFGKFMDPLADKLLVSAAMICLIATGQLAAWIVIVIISREFIIRSISHRYHSYLFCLLLPPSNIQRAFKNMLPAMASLLRVRRIIAPHFTIPD